jgi:creatinine amidohydrolase
MKIARMNWLELEQYLKDDDRVALPLGSVEQHAYLSLATDAVLAERIAADAAEPLGVPVFPALSYGVSTSFMGFPGTITLRPETYVKVIHDVLDSLVESGFRRILIVNGNEENAPANEASKIWSDSRPGIQLRFHDWWKGPRTRARIEEIDSLAGHGSWVDNFPWSRLLSVELPETRKPAVESKERSPAQLRKALGDGSFGGRYWRPEEQMMSIWVTAVAETRALLENPWND